MNEYWSSVIHMDNHRHRITENNWKFILHCRLVAHEFDASDHLFEETLLDILEARRGLGAMDPRDMLFAHPSCLKIGLRNSQELRLLRVDYGKSCVDVYLDIAKHCILTTEPGSLKTCSRLMILSYAGYSAIRSPDLIHLPSWCSTGH